MSIRKKHLIITIILWILVVLLIIKPIKESIENYKNGINIALEGTEMVYGMKAVSSTLSFYISFNFPIYAIWMLLLIASIKLTIVTISEYKKKV